jgi:hypothetical protein
LNSSATSTLFILHHKKLITYTPTSTTFTLDKLPIRKYWNALEPSVYLALFSWLAPFSSGRHVLKQFVTQAQPGYARANYLAFVVLTPVLKIVGHLMDISMIARWIDEPKDDKIKILRNHKYRRILMFYVASSYLRALTLFSEKSVEDINYTGQDIANMGGVTEILMNLPREFQRWNKYYGQDNKNIAPGANDRKRRSRAKKDDDDDDDDSDEAAASDQELPRTGDRPFDVKAQIHPSFQVCLFEKNKVPTEDDIQTLTLGPKWDPFDVTVKMMNPCCDIKVADMFNEPIEMFSDGTVKRNKPRGSTATNKRKKDADPETTTNKKRAAMKKKPKNNKTDETDDSEDYSLHEDSDDSSKQDTTALVITTIIKEHVQSLTGNYKQKATPTNVKNWNSLAQQLVESLTTCKWDECEQIVESDFKK